MRKIVTRTISRAGLPVSDEIFEDGDGGNGNEAIEKINRNTVDVILCDIKTLGMGGRSFVKKTRENEADANVDGSIAKITLLYRTSKS